MPTINLTGGNEKLAKLKTLRRDEWLSLQVKQLPKSVSEVVKVFYKALTTKDLDDEETVTRVKYEEGFYERSYAPAIYSSENNELLLCLGNQKIVLTKDHLKEFSAEIVTYKFEQYDETCLQLMYAVDEDNILLWPLQLKLNEDNYKIEEAKLKLLLKKPNTDSLAKCLYVKGENSGGFSDEKPGVITDLPPNTDLPIVGVKELLVKAKSGGKRLTHIVTVKVDDKEKRIWANTDINNVFTCGGQLTDDSYLHYFTRKKGEKEKVFVNVANIDYIVEDLDEDLKV